MVNTRTDAELSAVVQNALQTLLPQIREEFRTSSGPSDSGGNPPPVTIYTWLERFNKQKPAEIREEFRTGFGPSGSGGNPPPITIHTWLERFNKQNPRSFEKATAPLLVLRRSRKRTSGGVFASLPLTTSCVFHLRMWLRLPMLLATMRSSMRGMMMTLSDQTRGRRVSRGPSEGYSYPVCTTCGCRHPRECRRAAGTCFKCGQTGHLQKDCNKNTAASTSGQAD
nr:hypothetical protein [Tanacetum cinerariifolium]